MVKPFKQYLTETKTIKPIKTKNENHGFFGEIQSMFEADTNQAEVAWNSAFKPISAKFPEATATDIRNFLDSVNGRHLVEAMGELNYDYETKTYNFESGLASLKNWIFSAAWQKSFKQGMKEVMANKEAFK